MFYAHSVGRTLSQVRDEAQLREQLEEFLDAQVAELSALPGSQVRDRIREYVGGDPALSWALRPPKPPGLTWRLRETAHKIAVPALLLVTLPVGIPALAALGDRVALARTVRPLPRAGAARRRSCAHSATARTS